jgi:hypothetical protein
MIPEKGEIDSLRNQHFNRSRKNIKVIDQRQFLQMFYLVSFAWLRSIQFHGESIGM